MTEVVGVRFGSAGKIYYFDPDENELTRGESVIVETTRGLEMGECVLEKFEVEDDKVVKPLRKVIRTASEDDLKRASENRGKEKQALQICQQKSDEHGLEMKIVDVEYTFDGSKILFYFTADGRVDFRDLVKDLASIFRARIELRQIGVRDEAKMLGGLGICGREFCCSKFLGEFHPVSIKMAKEQNLSLNPVKISGSCGRLMCCLKYEQDAYTHLLKTVYPKGSLVESPEGEGTVVDVNLLRQRLKVRIEGQDDSAGIKEYPMDALRLIRSGKLKIKPPEKKKKREDELEGTEEE